MSPCNISSGADGSVLVADYQVGAIARQVWPDGSHLSLPWTTTNASAVLAVDGNVARGLIIVSPAEGGRVERTACATNWARTDLEEPWAAVVLDRDVLLVTEGRAGRVAVLDLATGKTRATFGSGTLSRPCGIAVGPSSEILVADIGNQLVHVFDHQGRALRSLGHGLLHGPSGVCVDSDGRVFVADSDAQAVVVLDLVSQVMLETIKVDGKPMGVAVTCCGRVLTSVCHRQDGLQHKSYGQLTTVLKRRSVCASA
jgi:DNA-binding beta-propeller fold protein YncE